MGRPEWRPERGITDSAVEAQAQAILAGGSGPAAREGSAPCDARGLPPASSACDAQPGYGGFIHRVVVAADAALGRDHSFGSG